MNCSFCPQGSKTLKNQGNGKKGNLWKHVAHKHIRIVNSAGGEVSYNFESINVYVMFNKELWLGANECDRTKGYIVVKEEDFLRDVEFCNQERMKNPTIQFETLKKLFVEMQQKSMIMSIPRIAEGSSNNLSPIISSVPQIDKKRKGGVVEIEKITKRDVKRNKLQNDSIPEISMSQQNDLEISQSNTDFDVSMVTDDDDISLGEGKFLFLFPKIGKIMLIEIFAN